ncbi:unnamed protein product [Calicophoron daubneyi]|uniref:Uncharacterized protein n=1 Tax=Calicophoron daubneyi TaxID=300641 RepID=A0AAV2TBK5_CALDB
MLEASGAVNTVECYGRCDNIIDELSFGKPISTNWVFVGGTYGLNPISLSYKNPSAFLDQRCGLEKRTNRWNVKCRCLKLR